MSLRTRRTWRRPPLPPAGIGHNQGPPLDAFAALCWRKARKRAWTAAPAEVVRRRARRAQELGLSYRDYTAVVLDRGTHPQALIFVLGGGLAETGLDAKLSGLEDCKVFVFADESRRPAIEVLRGVTTDGRIHHAPTPGRLRALLAENGLSPSAALLIGESERDRHCAEAAGLARFVWAGDYFGGAYSPKTSVR